VALGVNLILSNSYTILNVVTCQRIANIIHYPLDGFPLRIILTAIALSPLDGSRIAYFVVPSIATMT